MTIHLSTSEIQPSYGYLFAVIAQFFLISVSHVNSVQLFKIICNDMMAILLLGVVVLAVVTIIIIIIVIRPDRRSSNAARRTDLS